MHIIMINATPRMAEKSNTQKAISQFCEGFRKNDTSVEQYMLSDRNQWEQAKHAFFKGTNIVFALPLYNGGVPGIMMEFLEQISEIQQKSSNGSVERKISFILQSGFPEACQRRCCERYLKKLPEMLDSTFAGVLSHGNTFGMAFQGMPAGYEKMTYQMMGELFEKNEASFFFDEVKLFNGPEYISEKEAVRYGRVFRFFCERTAEALGYSSDLGYQPYHCNEE